MASGAIPTPPPTSSGRRPSRGAAEPDAERPDQEQLVAAAELAQALGPRADVLDQELELGSPPSGPAGR